MEDRDFFGLLHQTWSKTTGAEDRFWMPKQAEASDFFHLVAAGQDETVMPVAYGLKDEDADFISAVHGCLPDLVRRLMDALDEADRLDEYVDCQTQTIAELVLENQRLEELAEQEREQAEYWRSHK